MCKSPKQTIDKDLQWAPRGTVANWIVQSTRQGMVQRDLHSEIPTQGSSERASYWPRYWPLWEGSLGVRERGHSISSTGFEFLTHAGYYFQHFLYLERNQNKTIRALSWRSAWRRGGASQWHTDSWSHSSFINSGVRGAVRRLPQSLRGQRSRSWALAFPVLSFPGPY